MALFPSVENEIKKEENNEIKINISENYNNKIVIYENKEIFQVKQQERQEKKEKKIQKEKKVKKEKKNGKKEKKLKEKKKKRKYDYKSSNSYLNSDDSSESLNSDNSSNLNDSFDSFDSFDESNESNDNKEKRKKLKKENEKRLLLTNTIYLPNGNIMIRNDNNLQENQDWKINREKDLDFLQFGSFYRLNIPDYDIFHFHQFHKKTNNQNDFNSQKKNKLLSTTSTTITHEDSSHYSSSRYYHNTNSIHGTDIQTYCPRRISKKFVKQTLQTSFMIPLPPPLQFNQNENQQNLISTNNSSNSNNNYDNNLLSTNMFTDIEIARKSASNLLSITNSTIRSSPKDIFSYVNGCKAQGKIVWLQSISSFSDRGSLSSLWKSITERQISIIEDGINNIKTDLESSNMELLVPLYLLLIHHSMLWQECVSDIVFGASIRSEWEGQPLWRQILNIWQRAIHDCSLSPLIMNKYLKYQQHLSGVNNSTKNTSLPLSSISPCTTTGIRSLISFQCNKLQRDTKNILIARSISRQSGSSWFSGVSSLSIPSRLQDDIDSSIADSVFELAKLEEKVGNTERKYATIQAILELNLHISISIQRQNQRYTDEELKKVLLSTFLAFWESEYPRIGDQTSFNYQQLDYRGYLHWCQNNKPVDGWIFGNGITGNSSNISLNNTIEPTGENLYNFAIELNNELSRLCNKEFIETSSSTNVLNSIPNSINSIDIESDKNIIKSNSTLKLDSNSNSSSTSSSTNHSTNNSNANTNIEQKKLSLTRRKAIDFFEYTDLEEDNDNQQELVEQKSESLLSKSKSKTKTKINEGEDNNNDNDNDDSMIYSRVHGYKIKINPQEDTSLAYKKILGDIKDTDLTKLKTADVLNMAKIEEIPKDIPQLLYDSQSEFISKWKYEDILHSLQWRPLRVSSDNDSIAAENQPNRVIFSEDLNVIDYHLTSMNQLGRERLVIRSLEALDVKFPFLESSHYASFLPENYLSNYWNQFLEGCIEFSHIKNHQPNYLQQINCLLSKLSSKLNLDDLKLDDGADFFIIFNEIESVCYFTPNIIKKHQCCVLLGLSSPLDFTIRMIQDILITYNRWKDQGFEIFSLNFQRFLKSCLLTLISERMRINNEIPKNLIKSSIDSLNFDANKFRELSIELLQGEEILQEIDNITTITNPSMDVWNNYIDAELRTLNINQAKKAMKMSITSLGGYAIRNYDIKLKDNTIILDIIDNCVSSLIIPNEFQSQSEKWKLKEKIKLKGLYTLSTIPGSLNIYWKVIKLTLADVIPQILPSIYKSFSSIWNQKIQKSSVGICEKDLNNTMNVIYQLSDGGCDLSDIQSLVQLNNEDKKKKKEKKSETIVSYNENTISNILNKLECLCELTFQSFIKSVDKERNNISTEKDINAVRLDIHQLSVSSTISEVTMSIVIFIWSTFIFELKKTSCNINRNLRSINDSENIFSTIIQRCDTIFVNWINRLKYLLFGDNVTITNLSFSSLFIQQNSHENMKGVFETLWYGKVSCKSCEEQQVLISIEHLHLFRIQFLFLASFYWQSEKSVQLDHYFGSFWISYYYKYINNAISQGLDDFPMNKYLLHTLLLVQLCKIRINSTIQIRLSTISSGQLFLKTQTQKLRRKLFPVGLDSLGVMLQLCGDIYYVIQLNINLDVLIEKKKENELFLYGELKYLCMGNWSRSTRLMILNIFEKLLLRIVPNTHISSSFTLYLQNNLTHQSDAGDIGITSMIRSYPILWRLYLILECVNVQSIKNNDNHSVSNLLIYEDLERRLTLFFRGDELNNENEEIIAGRNISILKGSLRSKEIWMESSLGQLILLHLRLERYKRTYKEEQYNELKLWNDKNIFLNEEKNVMKQLINSMVKREIEYRNINE